MAATRKFYVRRTSSFKKNLGGGDVGGDAEGQRKEEVKPPETGDETKTPETGDETKTPETNDDSGGMDGFDKPPGDEVKPPEDPKEPEEPKSEESDEPKPENSTEEADNLPGDFRTRAQRAAKKIVNGPPEKQAKERQAKVDEKLKDVNQEIVQKWERNAQRDKNIARAMAGLRLAGDLGERALGVMDSLRGVVKTFLENPLSAPMGSAKRIMVDTIMEAGALAQDISDDIGKLWGIKDGVKDPKDIAGTYRGAKYYEDQEGLERTQAMLFADLAQACSDVFGKDADPKRFGDLLLKTIEDRDIEKLNKIKDAFKARMESDQGKKYREKVMREMADKYNDGIPKEQKFKASAEAKSFVSLYDRYMRGITNAYDNIHINASRDVAGDRNLSQQLNEHEAMKKRIALANKRMEKAKTAEEKKAILGELGDYGQFVLDAEALMGREGVVDYNNMASDGFPVMGEAVENALYKNLNNKRILGSPLSESEQRMMDVIEKRRALRKRGGESEGEATSPDRIAGLYRRPDDYGGSISQSANKEIFDACETEMKDIEDKMRKEHPEWGEDDEELMEALRNDPRYIDLHNAKMAAWASSRYNASLGMLDAKRDALIKYWNSKGLDGVVEYEERHRRLIESRKAVAEKWKRIGQNTEYYDADDVPEWKDMENIHDDIEAEIKDMRRSTS